MYHLPIHYIQHNFNMATILNENIPHFIYSHSLSKSHILDKNHNEHCQVQSSPRKCFCS